MPLCKSSLRKQFLVWLLIPQLIFWFVGVTLAYSVALYYTHSLIDQNLQQTARTIVAVTEWNDPNSNILLPQSVHHILKKAGGEASYYYSAYLTPGGFLFGNKKLPAPNYGAGEQRIFYTAQVDGQSLRAILLVQSIDSSTGRKWLTLQLAISDSHFSSLSREILWAISIPLALLALLTTALAWWGISRGLASFTYLQHLIESRKEQDLSPINTGNAPKELRSLFEALNHLLKSARENIDRQRSFIGDAAHQLRTPLAGLKSQTELAMRESTSEPQRERLVMVHTSATRSIHLVNQLLTLARSEPGNQSSILRVHMDLARLIRELTAELVPRAIAARIDLGCECSLSAAWIEGNSVLLRELFANLVENAIKYIPRDSSVTVRLLNQDGCYLVEVEDNGPGIPNEDKQRVFERFYRRQQDGSGCGLGMAIVKEIAERHGGKVILRDAVPHGLIVSISLPH